VDVIRFVSAVDCGQPIHPRLVEGQVEGAAVNGISYALWEDYLFNAQGAMRNASFGEYKIPTARDIPALETIVVESHEETGPFGAKSVAEVAINGPLPAIANAIYDAVGVRLYDAPFTAEKVLRAMKRMKDEG
jgi:CO/xanthine dehydrogenase Mo-binding subunit